MKRKKGGGAESEAPTPRKKAAGGRAQDGHAECDCEALASTAGRRVFKNFSTACAFQRNWLCTQAGTAAPGHALALAPTATLSQG
jgi:hypothetical protein